MVCFLLMLALFCRADEPPRSFHPESPTSPVALPDPAEGADEAGSQDLRADWLAWTARVGELYRKRWPHGHPEPQYRFLAEIHGQIAPWVRERPGVITPLRIGRTALDRPIWAFRIRAPGTETRSKILIFAGIHALEWISAEVATALLLRAAEHPIPGVELVILPLLNVDGRARVEQDFYEGIRPYRRGNAHGVDLNRDFAVHREARALWRRVVPGFYHTSPAPLSQPESRALDALAATERFDVAVSLHAFGGYFYYPWAGRYAPPEDVRAYRALARVMAAGQGTRAYHAKQLSHWGFFFRAQGAEIDHLYGQYGTLSFLIELTRSGIRPLRPKTWKDYFRWYNPEDPAPHVEDGVGALWALARAAPVRPARLSAP